MFLGVPTMYIGLLAAARDRRAPADAADCVSGGAALPVAVLDKFDEVFAADIYEGYGLSETSPIATFNQPVFGRKPGTVGHPIWGVEVEIAAAEIEDRIELLPAGELGEIVIRGHNVFAGYLNNPEATAAAHRGRLVPHRRPRHQRRRRLHLHRRPQEGPDHPRRVQRLPARGRGGAGRPPGGRPGRGASASPDDAATARRSAPWSSGRPRVPTSTRPR